MHIDGANVRPAGELSERESRERMAHRCIELAVECEEFAESHALQQAEFLRRALQLRERAASLRANMPRKDNA